MKYSQVFTAQTLNRRNQLATVIILIALALWGVSSMPSGAATQTGQRKRVIEETPYPDAPVQIIGVTNRRHPIKFKESFLDDDDWIEGLEIEFINKSEKTVTHVGINLVFERAADQAGDPRAVWPLIYGLNPFSLKPEEPILTNKIRPIRPGEKAYVSLSDLAYLELKSFLRDTRYFDGIEKMKIFVTTIGFIDGTAWGAASIFATRLKNMDGGQKNKSQAARKKVLPFLYPITTLRTGTQRLGLKRLRYRKYVASHRDRLCLCRGHRMQVLTSRRFPFI